MTRPEDLWLPLWQKQLVEPAIESLLYTNALTDGAIALTRFKVLTGQSAEVKSLDGGSVDGVKSLDLALNNWYASSMTKHLSTTVNSITAQILYRSMKSPTGRLNHANLPPIQQLYPKR